ncbi:GT4 family glycosyltransferase PelF [Succinivibrio sp.]|uniref:GT4 family glycosyltransferase PelF n=1 Tax=Succinivibrio sp. TaxID=2053619 RepID=UPI00386E8562
MKLFSKADKSAIKSAYDSILNKDASFNVGHKADICLLLEGTYPFVRGGVSSWVHQIITGMSDYTFYLVFIGGQRDTYKKMAYELPKNVVGLEMHYILPETSIEKKLARNASCDNFDIWEKVISYFDDPKKPIPKDLLRKFALNIGNDPNAVDNFLYSEDSWKVLTKRYEEVDNEGSFVDYFWTYRTIYQPLIELARVAVNLPEVKVLHSISTGYAGFLGALAHSITDTPYLLTEHGIYTKERKIDLSLATWISNKTDALDISMHSGMDLIRKIWINFFIQLGKSAYQEAFKVTALFEGNRERQISDGADRDKSVVVVNGIKTERFEEAYSLRPETPPHVVALVGRVVSIKDVKTFIRTIRGALSFYPDLQGWIVGPKEEDPEYVKECEALVTSLGLENNIVFTGNQDVTKIMPKIGIMMLTSISEAQPLVLLEAMCAGIPCIATNVGACSEILYGSKSEEPNLGKAGEIISIANPTQGIQMIDYLLKDANRWKEYGDNGRKRVLGAYDQKMMYKAYKDLYQGAMNGGHRV